MNRKKKTMKLRNQLGLVLLLLCSIACKKEPAPADSVELAPHWEVIYGQDSTINHHFGLAFLQQNEKLGGTAIYVDDKGKFTGTVRGSVVGNTVSFETNFDDKSYNFTFSGVLNIAIISGEMRFTDPSATQQGVLNVALQKSNSAVFDFGASPPPNEYSFTKVSTATQPDATPVILVHGMTISNIEWQLILDKLSPQFKEKHDLYLYQYNWQDSILINGRILKAFVDSAGIEQPIVIGHSMGGLVSRAYVASGGTISKLITLGTPNNGTQLSNLAPLLPQLNTAGPKDMAIGSKFITDLASNPTDLANRSKYYVVSGIMGGTFEKTPPYRWIWNETYYKDIKNGIVCLGWMLLNPFGANDGLVSVSSSLFEGGKAIDVFNGPLLWVDHMSLVYPERAPQVFDLINNL